MPIEIESLRNTPMFGTLADEDLARIAAVTRARQYDRGEIVLLAGETGGGLHIVHSGLIKVYKTSPEGKEQVLRLIKPPSTFNDVPALDGGPNPASAAAMERSTVYVIRQSDLRKLILERPAIAESIIRTLTGALRHLVELVEDLSFRHVTQRIAKMLAEQESAISPDGSGHRLTQQEMAAMAGTAREMVGRALKELESVGAIELHQGRIVVVSRERLQMML